MGGFGAEQDRGAGGPAEVQVRRVLPGEADPAVAAGSLSAVMCEYAVEQYVFAIEAARGRSDELDSTAEDA